MKSKKSQAVFTVHMNGTPVGTVGASKAAARRWVKENLVDIHMGQWVKKSGGSLEYSTTIGRYYLFERTEGPAQRAPAQPAGQAGLSTEVECLFGCSSAGRLTGEGNILGRQRFTERPRWLQVEVLSDERENGTSLITFRHGGRVWTASMDTRYEAEGGYHLPESDRFIDE